MRKLFLVMLMFPMVSYATEMVCYSGNRMIYSGKGSHILFDEGVFSIQEYKSKKYVFVNGSCVVKVVA